MDDFVERGYLVSKIDEAQRSLMTNNDALWELNQKYYKGLAWAYRIALEAPTIDAVEVVRCKGCKHTELCICVCCEGGEMVLCTKFHKHMNADDFCSYGERRANDIQAV